MGRVIVVLGPLQTLSSGISGSNNDTDFIYKQFYFRQVWTQTPGLYSPPEHLEITPDPWGHHGKGPYGVGSLPDPIQFDFR